MRLKLILVRCVLTSICGLTAIVGAMAQQCTGPVVHASDLINHIDAKLLQKYGPRHLIVSAPSVLLFDKKDPPVFLEGVVAEIFADCVKVEGDVTVQSYL